MPGSDTAGPLAARGMSLKILVTRPDHLGDVLLTLPAATALRGAFAGSRLALLVSVATADASRRCPDVDETIALTFPRLGDGSELEGAELARAVAAVRDRRFDIAVLCRPSDKWSGRITSLAEIPIRVGYAAPGMAQFLTHAVPFDGRGHAVVQSLRLAERAAASLGLGAAGVAALSAATLPPARARFVPSAAEEGLVRDLLRGLPGAGQRPIVLQPGSGWPVKSWSSDRWGALGRELRRRHGVTPLVNGGPGESSAVAAVVDASAGACVGIAGLLGLGALGALLGRSSLLIGIDSGPLHLAAMVGLPVVGLYGPLPLSQWRPWCAPESYRAVRVPLPCSPCDHILTPPCGIAVYPPCMSAISVDAVLRASSDLLATAELLTTR